MIVMFYERVSVLFCVRGRGVRTETLGTVRHLVLSDACSLL